MFKKHPPQRGNQPARQNNRLSPTISQRQPQPHDRPNLLHTNHGNSHNYRSKIPRIHQLWTNHHRNDPHIHRRTIHRPRHKRRPHKIPSTIPLRRQNMGSKLISQSGPDDQYPGRLNPHSTHLHLLRISGQTGLPSTRNPSTDPDFLLKPPRPVSAQHDQIDLHRIRANETGKPHGNNPIHNKERPIPAAGFFRIRGSWSRHGAYRCNLSDRHCRGHHHTVHLSKTENGNHINHQLHQSIKNTTLIRCPPIPLPYHQWLHHADLQLPDGAKCNSLRSRQLPGRNKLPRTNSLLHATHRHSPIPPILKNTPERQRATSLSISERRKILRLNHSSRYIRSNPPIRPNRSNHLWQFICSYIQLPKTGMRPIPTHRTRLPDKRQPPQRPRQNKATLHQQHSGFPRRITTEPLPNPTDGRNRPPYHHDNSYPCRAIVHTVLDTPKLRFLIDWRASAKTYLSSAIAFTPVFLILPLTKLPDWPQLLLGDATYAVIYLAMIIALKTLTIHDVQDLRRILASTEPLRPLFNFFLTIVEKTQTRN